MDPLPPRFNSGRRGAVRYEARELVLSALDPLPELELPELLELMLEGARKVFRMMWVAFRSIPAPPRMAGRRMGNRSGGSDERLQRIH